MTNEQTLTAEDRQWWRDQYRRIAFTPSDQRTEQDLQIWDAYPEVMRADTMSSLPGWIRNLHVGFDPRRVAGDAMTIPALPSTVAQLIGADEAAQALTNPTIQGWLDQGLSLRDEAMRFHNVSDPITVTPEGEIDVDISRLLLQEGPMAVMPLGGPVRWFGTGTNLTRASNAAAEIALNLAIPGAQGRYGPAAAISLGATTGLPGALAAVTDGEVTSNIDAPYVTPAWISGQVAQVGDTVDAIPLSDVEESITLVPLSALEQEMGIEYPMTPDQAFINEQQLDIQGLRPAEDGLNEIIIPDDNDLSAEILTGAAALAIIGGAAAGVRASRAAAAAATRRQASELAGGQTPAPVSGISPGQDVNETIRGPVTGLGDVIETQLIDRNVPLFNAVRDATTTTDPDYQLFRAQVSTTATPQAMASRIRDAAITGQMPNSQLRTVPLANHLEALSRLSPQQQASYDDVLTAMTRMDDMIRDRVNVWGSGPNAQTFAQLDARVQALRTGDPQVFTMVQEAQQMYRDLADYMLEAGAISADQRARWAANNSNYVPQRLDFADERGLLSQLSELDPAIRSEANFFRPRGEVGETIEPGDVGSIMRAHEVYFSTALRVTENNRLRRNFVDLVSQGLRDADGAPVVSRARQSGRDTITIRRGGRREYWRITDPGIRSALSFRPNAVASLLNGARRLAQEMSTGVLRPDFIPVSISYEVLSSIPMIRNGRGLGPVDQVLNTITGGRVRLNSADLSVFASPVTGTAEQAMATFYRSASQRLDMSLRFNGQLMQMLGNRNVAAIRDVMAQAYEMSTTRLYERFGGGNAVFLENAIQDRLPDVLMDIAPQFVRQQSTNTLQQAQTSRFVRMYMGTLTALHNSVRVQSAAASIPRRIAVSNMRLFSRDIPVIQFQPIANMDELTRIMADTRNLTGDVSQIGGDASTMVGRRYQQFLSQSMYANHFVQVTAQHARMMREHPIRYSTTIAGMTTAGFAYVMSQINDNPVAEDFYWRRMTAEQRARMIPTFDDSGDLVNMIMIPAELRLIWSPFVEGMGSALGYHVPIANEDFSPIRRAVTQALDAGLQTAQSDVLPNPIGPGIGATIGAMGVEPPDIGFGRYSAMDPRPPMGLVEQEDTRTELQDRAEIIINELLAGSSSMVIDSAEALVNSLDAGQSVTSAFDNSARAFFGPVRQPARTMFNQSLYGVDLRMSLADSTFDSLQPRLRNIDTIVNAFNREVRAPGQGTLSGGSPNVFHTRDSRDTEIGIIGSVTVGLQSWLTSRYRTPYADLRRRREMLLRNPAFSDPGLRNVELNNITEEMRILNEQALRMMISTEGVISEQLGRSFSFGEFDLDRSRSSSTRSDQPFLP